MQSSARQYPEMACHYWPFSFHIQNQNKTSKNYLTVTEQLPVFLQHHVGAESIERFKYKTVPSIWYINNKYCGQPMYIYIKATHTKHRQINMHRNKELTLGSPKISIVFLASKAYMWINLEISGFTDSYNTSNQLMNVNMSSGEGRENLIRCSRQIKPPTSVFSGHGGILTGMAELHDVIFLSWDFFKQKFDQSSWQKSNFIFQLRG